MRAAGTICRTVRESEEHDFSYGPGYTLGAGMGDARATKALRHSHDNRLLREAPNHLQRPSQVVNYVPGSATETGASLSLVR